MHRLTLVSLFIACLLNQGSTLFAQREQSLPARSDVIAVVTAAEKAKEVAGSVTMVVSDRDVLHFHASGFADVEAEHPMQPDSIFWIASMTKPLTGACLMMLVDEGKVALDDPISKYLSELDSLRMRNGEAPVITIRHLLTHTSGMSELPSAEAYTAKTLREAVQRYAKLEVMFEPGSKWQYSQTSINTAARVIEVVSGQSFDVFMDERLCRPLGMTDTTFYLTDEQLLRLAKSYSKNASGDLELAELRILVGRSPTDRDRFPAANGGAFSTASDYARFCQMLLNNGAFGGTRILSEEAVKTMSTIHTGDLVTGFTPGNGWGIGCCVIREPQGITEDLSPGSFGHGGAYGTQAWIDPAKKQAYILMVQRANFPNADGSELRHRFQKAAASLVR